MSYTASLGRWLLLLAIIPVFSLAAEAPTAARQGHPHYPVEAAEAGVEGTVVVSYRIARNGQPRDIRLESADPEGYFEEAALAAMKQWHWQRNDPDVRPGYRYRKMFEFQLAEDYEIVDAGEALQPLRKVAPPYPSRAAEARVSGYVVMDFNLDASGRPVDIEVHEAHPDGWFDHAALWALEHWRFVPPGEELQERRYRQKIEFVME